MRRTVLWWSVAAACFVVALLAFVFAFTRFPDEDPPVVGSPEADGYEQRLMGQARWAAFSGLLGCSALLGGFASAQRARRTGTSS